MQTYLHILPATASIQTPVIEAQDIIGSGAHLADGDGKQDGTTNKIKKRI